MRKKWLLVVVAWLVSVSYTHLDVYKRQEEPRAKIAKDAKSAKKNLSWRSWRP